MLLDPAAEIQQLGQVFVQERCGAAAPDKNGMVQNLVAQLRVGGEALQSEFLQAAGASWRMASSRVGACTRSLAAMES